MEDIKLNCLVTGASRGLGKAICDVFASPGVQIFAPARQELDLANDSSVRRFLLNFDQRVDVLVNNAAENVINEIPQIKIENWHRMMQINLTSPFLLVQKFATQMAERGFGRIVNIVSCYAFRARVGRAIYSVTKAGLDALTRTAALEFAPKGVLVNSVSPGFVDTELTRKNNSPEQIRALVSRIPLGRLASPSEVAQLVCFLASRDNSYITGQNFVIDGGFSIQ